jgi:hypothetical protein
MRLTEPSTSTLPQYDAADPTDCLVAGELEVCWNRVLARVAEVEAKITAHHAATPRLEIAPTAFATLGHDLQVVSRPPSTHPVTAHL